MTMEPQDSDAYRIHLFTKLNELKEYLPPELRADAERMIAENLPELAGIEPSNKRYRVRLIREDGEDIQLDEFNTKEKAIECSSYMQKYSEQKHPDRTLAFYIQEVEV